MVFCDSCGSAVEGSFCPQCGKPVGRQAAPPPAYPQAQRVVSRKEPGLAAVLSFFIAGLGQIYIGRIGRGVGILVAAVILGGVAVITFGILGIVAFIFWIWQIYDAYKLAEAYNRQAGQAA